jgi:hypothetical protein
MYNKMHERMNLVHFPTNTETCSVWFDATLQSEKRAINISSNVSRDRDGSLSSVDK